MADAKTEEPLAPVEEVELEEKDKKKKKKKRYGGLYRCVWSPVM
jgi:hypothetical protein